MLTWCLASSKHWFGI